MVRAPGTIGLGKYRVAYEEEAVPAGQDTDEYILQQRAVLRLNKELTKLECAADYTVFCDEKRFRTATGKRPSPLQYFIASVGFCMLSQLTRIAARLGVTIKDLEMDLRMTYSRRGSTFSGDGSAAAQGLSYILKLESQAPAERVIRLAQLTDKGCHTVNSMRKRLSVTGKLVLNERVYEIRDWSFGKEPYL